MSVSDGFGPKSDCYSGLVTPGRPNPDEVDHQAEAQALATFLRADPQEWAALAPRVVEVVGIERLRSIVAGTSERVGTPLQVRDSSEGLLIEGPKGRALGWAGLSSGRINSLLIAPYRSTGRGKGIARLEPAVRVVTAGLFVWFILSPWTTHERGEWLGNVLILLSVYMFLTLIRAMATQPWWYRWAGDALALATVASVWRWPDLRRGGVGWVAVGMVVLAGVSSVVVRGRRHRWGVGPAHPLNRFPLSSAWLVVQGGGRWLNHHYSVPAQRGAIDVVRVGRDGVKGGGGRSLEDFLSYGEEIVSPCDGVVLAAVDGLPDQIPGRIRFMPTYGNHVIIDTGTESVVLAHLRPGTVAVAVGDRVRAGQNLGQVGNSGNSTMPHLHLQVERDGVGLDLDFATIDGNLYRGRTVRG